MSVNYSDSSPHPLIYYCFDCSAAVSIFNSFIVTKILLCGTLSILVFYVGHQQWRQQQQRSTKTTSSDIFTYHMAAMELGSLAVCVFYFYGSYTEFPMMAKVSLYIFSMTFPGEICFHCLTCVERYLAVVHPIIYRGLRQSGGVMIRNISTGCSWLVCFEWIHVKTIYSPHFPAVPFFCFLAFSLVVVSFCSLSVLHVLIRPGPGDVGCDEKRIDQTKLRAFHTVMAILAVLWLWFLGLFVCFSLEASPLLSYSDGCMVMMFGIWFCLPSSLVLPLLFLHRTGKLTCFCKSKK